MSAAIRMLSWRIKLRYGSHRCHRLKKKEKRCHVVKASHVWAATVYTCHSVSASWPIRVLPFHSSWCCRNYLWMRCTDVTMYCEMTFLFCDYLSGVALKEMCHCNLDNKVALCTKTNPLRLSYPPEDTFTQCSSVSVYIVWMWSYKGALFSDSLWLWFGFVTWGSPSNPCNMRLPVCMRLCIKRMIEWNAYSYSGYYVLKKSPI